MVEILIRWHTVILPAAWVVLGLAVLVLLIILIRRRPGQLVAELAKSFAFLQDRIDHVERLLREESARSRQE